MKDISIKELKNTATQMRMKVIDMIYKAQSGHPGGSLSAADFVTACYFKYMNIDPKDPRWPDRDRMVLSKGHVCPIQYACLASVGFFPESELDTLRKEGSMLQGHPSMNRCPGIDISTGSLGQGLACAVGMAMAGKMDHKDYKVFCVVGHSMEEIVACIDKCYASKNGKPKCLYAHTVKGRGVSFMENQCGWHGVAPNDEQYAQAMAELKAQLID